MHTPSIAFRHLHPNSARTGYTTEGDTLSPCSCIHRRYQRPPKGSGTDQTPSTGLRHSSFNHCRINFSYALGSRKLSANEQFLVGAQTAARLLQTTQIKQGVSFIAANKVYTSTNKTTIV